MFTREAQRRVIAVGMNGMLALLLAAVPTMTFEKCEGKPPKPRPGPSGPSGPSGASGPTTAPTTQPKRMRPRLGTPPSCNGSCAAPADTEDCSSCCGNEALAQLCCETMSGDARKECEKWKVIRVGEGYLASQLSPEGEVVADAPQVPGEPSDVPNPMYP